MKTKISKLGLLMIYPEIFTDLRGQYVEVYNETWVPNDLRFVQDSAIVSTFKVIRGYHGDYDTWKYVTCLNGEFELSVACIDPENSMFGKEEILTLDTINRVAVLIPPKFVNAHQCVSPVCTFFYKQTTLYRGEKSQYTVRYDNFNRQWLEPAILSHRDREHARLYTDYIRNGVLLKPEKING